MAAPSAGGAHMPRSVSQPFMQTTVIPNRLSRPKSTSGLSSTNPTRSGNDEAKTSVKVAIRLRPPLSPDDPTHDLIPARFRRSACQVSNPTTLCIDSSKGKKLFLFDRVFADHETQEDVWDYVSPGVDSFVQGYNVSLLAYGQSGAGKSYTMGTTRPLDQQTPAATGIIPRAAAALFEKLSQAQPKSGLRVPTRYPSNSAPPSPAATSTREGKAWQLHATYVEIYNEQLRDLLVSDVVPVLERPNVTIREDAKGRILLTGLKQVPISSVNDLMSALHFGSAIRQTDATAINSISSRSHAVFSLNLVQKRSRSPPASSESRPSSQQRETMIEDSSVTIDSKLHFVDLAGSERLKNSGLTGERVKEGISINAGLASLGKVISQLSSRASGSHVSYRDSRLTRMLQDSLGGSAITYMVACINPAEFHLSESLNTVQYAQRARAIQIRPLIQQRSDDGDKQLIIDRLRAEVKFLREQIRASQTAERRKTSSHDRTVRNLERENELQNQLLDIQENYSALSQRHARVIAEVAVDKVDDTTALPTRFKGALEYTARSRAHMHSTFAEQVEQVILEYERTIQGLESSLSNTRSSLSTSESHLLEREAKIVYMEALAQQHQTRYSKAMDREANGETYVQELEAKLDSVSTGEDKQAIVIHDLRRELSRIREGEASAEEYISTLEERLAETEQDTEVMRREIDRLEHVVDRHRSVGKLDNLLSELDELRSGEVPSTTAGAANRFPSAHREDMFHDRLVATAAAHHPNGQVAPESAEEEWKSFGPMEGDDDVVSSYTSTSDPAKAEIFDPPFTSTARHMKLDGGEKVHSQAQARVIADKLETLTMELFELRGEHQSTAAELEDVSRKYQIALSTLAELQDAVAGSRPTHPTSMYLDGTGAIPDARDEAPRSSSRMLSADLSSRGNSPTLVDPSENDTALSENGDMRLSVRVLQKEETLAGSIRALKRANAEKDINITELTENYSQLEDQHNDTLRYIDELKEEMSKLQSPASSPTTLAPTSLGRRRSLLNISRESRVLAALQTVTVEHLSGQPQALKACEQIMEDALTEAQLRQERVEALEGELAASRKEIGSKNTMISGLHRERASRSTTTPADVGLVAAVRDQLVQTREYLSSVRSDSHAQHGDIISSIKSFAAHLQGLEPPSAGHGNVAPLSNLPSQLDSWETKTSVTHEAVQALEQKMSDTITGLGVCLANIETLHSEKVAAGRLRESMQPKEPWEAEKEKHDAHIATLEGEISKHKAKAQEHAGRVALLENSWKQIVADTAQNAKSRELAEKELQTQRGRIASLGDQLDQQKSLATFHQQSLQTMQETHVTEVEGLKAILEKGQTEAQGRIGQQKAMHETAMSALREELTTISGQHAALLQGMSGVLQGSNDSANYLERLRALAGLETKHNDVSRALQKSNADVAETRLTNLELQGKIKELNELNVETMLELEEMVAREQKSSKLVQDLEEQLAANFDQHKTASRSLSVAKHDCAAMENQLDAQRNRVSVLEHQLVELKPKTMPSSYSPREGLDARPVSTSSAQLHRSSSQVSFPPASPPPDMPLPAIPRRKQERDAASQSPRASRHSRDLVLALEEEYAKHIQALELQVKAADKKLGTERQLTQTLEQALIDLENLNNRTTTEAEAWKRKCRDVEEEALGLRSERGRMRNSMQQLQEETVRRKTAEDARRRLEEQMSLLAQGDRGKKKKGALNCF